MYIKGVTWEFIKLLFAFIDFCYCTIASIVLQCLGIRDQYYFALVLGSRFTKIKHISKRKCMCQLLGIKDCIDHN
jgi:hypothetical protein